MLLDRKSNKVNDQIKFQHPKHFTDIKTDSHLRITLNLTIKLSILLTTKFINFNKLQGWNKFLQQE